MPSSVSMLVFKQSLETTKRFLIFIIRIFQHFLMLPDAFGEDPDTDNLLFDNLFKVCSCLS